MKKAIIIGAGPAGLTAAYELLKRTDIKPIVFEASDYIGGISKTIKHGEFNIDVGPHHFFTKQAEIKEIWDELLPEQAFKAKDGCGPPSAVASPGSACTAEMKQSGNDGPDPEKEDSVMLVRNRCTRILYNNKFFSYPLSFTFETIKKLGVGRAFVFAAGLIRTRLFKLKESSLEDYLINCFGTTLYKEFFRDYTMKAWGCDPSEISSECGTQRIKGISVRKAVKEFVKNTLRIKGNVDDKEGSINEVKVFKYPKYGAGQLWENMAKRITEQGGQICKNSRVVEIVIKDNNTYSVVVETSASTSAKGGKEVFEADYVISSLTINELFSCLGDRGIDKTIYNAAVNLPHRDFIMVALLLDELALKNDTDIKTLRNNTLAPDCWSYIYSRNVYICRFNIFNNFSPYIIKDWENKILLGLEIICSETDDLWRMADNECIEIIAAEAERLGLINRANIIEGVRIRERKAYPAYYGSYSSFKDIKNYLNSLSNLYTIGRKGQHNYIDMDQSMMTAIECVRNIKDNIASREHIWDVND